MKLGRIGRRAVRNPNATPPSLDAVSRPPYLIDGADPMEPMPDDVTEMLNDDDREAEERREDDARSDDSPDCDCRRCKP